MVVEIWLVYFSCAKTDYVSEIPVVSGIPVQDVTSILTLPLQPSWCLLGQFQLSGPAFTFPHNLRFLAFFSYFSQLLGILVVELLGSVSSAAWLVDWGCGGGGPCYSSYPCLDSCWSTF